MLETGAVDDVEKVKRAKLDAEKRQFMIDSLADGIGGQRKVELACFNRGMVGNQLEPGAGWWEAEVVDDDSNFRGQFE